MSFKGMTNIENSYISLFNNEDSLYYNQNTKVNVSSLKNNKKVQAIRNSSLFKQVFTGQCPIVYSDNYNISFYGLEKLHPFDSKKWKSIHKILIKSGKLNSSSVIEPVEITTEDLKLVHNPNYLKSLHIPCVLAKILEIEFLALFPYCLTNCKILRPMRYQTGGTILASKLALDFGWAINIGGGFHHASANHGGGFCVYADITLALKFLFEGEFIQKAMIIDLDAHQGNGFERDFKRNDNVYIFDMYNAEIYPNDTKAKEAIDRVVQLRCNTSQAEYIYRLTNELNEMFEEFIPNIIIYNAGTDSLRQDALGYMNLSSEAIIKRDELVFDAARCREIPIVMLTSGGYSRDSAQVIADSILNLNLKKLIKLHSHITDNSFLPH